MKKQPGPLTRRSEASGTGANPMRSRAPLARFPSGDSVC